MEHVARMGDRRDAFMVLARRPEGEKIHFEDLDVNGRIILKWMLKKQDWCMDWIELAQDRDSWRVLVDVVKNLRVS